MEVFHDTATECHLQYGITQCYLLLPDTSEHIPAYLKVNSYTELSQCCTKQKLTMRVNLLVMCPTGATFRSIVT